MGLLDKLAEAARRNALRLQQERLAAEAEQRRLEDERRARQERDRDS